MPCCIHICEQNQPNPSESNIILPVMIYIGFWTVSLSGFLYSYYKIHNHNNKFNQCIDNIAEWFYPTTDDELAKYDYKQTFQQINEVITASRPQKYYVMVNDSDDEENEDDRTENEIEEAIQEEIKVSYEIAKQSINKGIQETIKITIDDTESNDNELDINEVKSELNAEDMGYCIVNDS